MRKNISKFIKKHKFIISGIAIVFCIAIVILFPTFSEKTTSSVWDGTIATSFASGSGTQEEPYVIVDGSHLAYFFQLINEEDSTEYFNKHYVLENNIDLNNHDFSFIKINKTFSGVFDGKGYTISNFNLNSCIESSVGTCEYGLFNNINNAHIKNINYKDIDVSVNSQNQNINIALILNAENSSIENISLYDVQYNTESQNQIAASGLLKNDNGNNTIKNIHLELHSNIQNTTNLVSNYNNSTIETIIYLENNYPVTNTNTEISNLYSYNKTNNLINFNGNYATKSIIEILNSNSSYTWIQKDNTLRLKNNGMNEMMLALEYETGIEEVESGVQGSIVYVNDFEADFDYYQGLNFTTSTDGSLPTRDNKNIYNETNLVYVKATYNGGDYAYTQNNQNGYVGYVSPTENQNTLVYFKVYPVNNNGTASLNDDYVEFDLIDNPFAMRPNNLAFNGWLTDYENAQIDLNLEKYVRTVKIPITYTGEKPTDIIINFYSSWIDATTYNLSGNNWTTAFEQIDNAGLKPANGTRTFYELTNYYYNTTITRGQTYPNDSYASSGGWFSQYEDVSGESCNSNSCSFYTRVLTNDYDANIAYYQMQTGWNISFNRVYPEPITLTGDDIDIGDVVAGYYREVVVPQNQSLVGFYNSDGSKITTGNCTTNGGCTTYEKIGLFDASGNIEVAVEDVYYFSLVTRDTNIIFLTGNVDGVWSNQTKPFTFTAINNGTNNISSYYWRVRTNTVGLGADTRIEMMRIYSGTNLTSTEVTPGSGSTIRGNWNNLKIGRGIARYNNNAATFSGVIGGSTSATGSAADLTEFTLIVESGFYNSFGLASGSGLNGNAYIHAYGIYGNDYDRVTENNENLIIRHCASGSWSGNIRSTGITDSALYTNIKSGQYGPTDYNYATGVYVGGRAGGGQYAPREAIIEGGDIFNLIGGPLSQSTNQDYNDTYIYIKGGTIDVVVGGAGASATYGNRIVQATGGKVNYALFGGSNGVTGGDSGSYLGTLNGDSYVYVGGHAEIGDETLVNNNTMQAVSEVEAGSVFGIGNGNSSSQGVGSVDNSIVIIDGNALVRRNVYGGGNYGSTGYSSSSSTSTTYVDIHGGTINGSVYGGGNNNGSGRNTVSSTITITMDGGTVGEAIYGGSRTKGTVYGSSNIYVTGGTVDYVYGGGEGGYTNNNSQGTFVRDNVKIEIGTAESGPTINHNVYGGSAFGTVNATTYNAEANNNTVTVTVNNGQITGSVFGGAEGNNTYTPYVKGDITVNINGGTIGSVYGGFDAAGKPQGDVVVYLNGGVIGSSFGGGNNTSIDTTKIYLRGAETQYLYGGSNQSGDVITTNVYIESGTVTNAFGGNNIGGTCTTANVLVTGGTIQNALYGGGNEVFTTTTNIDLTNHTGQIPYVYGGGNQAGATTTNIEALDTGSNINVNNLFGGSNQSGDVNESNIILNKGTYGNVFGGNDAGGLTSTSNILFKSTTAENIYGGGNKAEVVTTNVTIEGGQITNVYGGGNEAVVTTSKVDIKAGTITNVYGAGNQAGADTANVNLYNGTITSVYGAGNQAGADTTNVKAYIDTSTANIINVGNVYGGSNQSGEVINANVVIDTGTYNQVFGGNNAGGTTTNAKVVITNANITDVYGGGNKAQTEKTIVEIHNGTITNIYGGGNEASAGSTDVSITNGNIGSIYGGGNAAEVTGNTSLKINGGHISNNIFGGGNNGAVEGNTSVTIKNAVIEKSAFAGGNGQTATVYGDTYIVINDGTTIGTESCSVLNACSVFGGGNRAFTGTESVNDSTATVIVAGGTIYGNVYGGANTSVVYGQTDVDIGINNSTDTITKGDIFINGTIFGGGEANASGSDDYDYKFISVTKAIDIEIDATNYTNFDINGSIFGSGNASSSGGTSQIYIKNYGTHENPMQNVSIQRTNLLTIDNSALLLYGTTDRTNEYSDTFFSLSIIDELRLKNNSTLYMENGANLLKVFKSIDADGNLAEVEIDQETATFTKTVDNRVYMLGGVVLNVAKNQSTTEYGDVFGMTFFGMYKYRADGSVNVGIYDKFGYDEQLSWGGVIDEGSYVMGAHKENHDITVDGFYTNYIDEETGRNKLNYITPTPPTGNMYMWVVGEAVREYSIDLMASKYSTLGAVEYSFVDFSEANTSFEVLGFDYSGLNPGITLVDKTEIARIEEDEYDANNKMGLTMEASNTGWLTTGATTFYSNEAVPFSGVTKYVGENTPSVPTMLFYLHHAKNITENGPMGSVKIIVMAITKINDLKNETERIVINVNLSRMLITSSEYEATITEGRKYDLFTSTSVNITSKSAFSTYFSLFKEGKNIYKTGYHRSLVSNYVLPLNTKITMIDISSEVPEYYYHVINETDVANATSELALEGDIQYDLSMFEVMGAFNSGKYYDNVQKNNQYYNDEREYGYEEFIFIFDFEDTNITENALNKSIVIEMLDANDETIIPVLGNQYQSMIYNIYTNQDALIAIDGTISNSTIYAGENVTLDLQTSYTQSTTGAGNTIYDTKYLDYKLGLKISLINSAGEIVTGTSLIGLYYEIDGVKYYPNIDGTTRIKISDKVGNVQTWVRLVTGTSTLATGDYTLKIETFGSPDGIYYGLNTSDSIEYQIHIINEIYGLDIDTPPEEMIIDSVTGRNVNDEKSISYSINYNSGLATPNLHVKLYRRNYNIMYDTGFTLVDLQDYVTNTLISTDIENEYLVVNNPNEQSTLTLLLKENLQIGTYKMEFILYDGTSAIGTVDKYFIIK